MILATYPTKPESTKQNRRVTYWNKQAHPRINLLKINATTKATTYLPQREGEGEEGEGGEGGAETVKGEWEGRREVGGEVGGDGSAGKGEDKVVGGRGG